MKTRRLLLTVVLALGLTLAVLAGMVGSLPCARADTYTVTNTNASGLGSLRQAILDTNGNLGHDIIDFGVNGTIVLTGALPAISDDLTIIGPGAEQLAVSGDNAYRVFEIVSNTAMTMTGLTVRDGQADNGGGIWSAGALHLDSVRIMSNTASGIYPDGRGGGVYVDEGSATLNMSGGQITDNSAYYGGGVGVEYGSVTLSGTLVYNNSADRGGGVYVDEGSATLNETWVLSNSAGFGGGVGVGYGSATLNGTQVLGNSASSFGGGVGVRGGSATLNMSGGEINDNSADYYGGGVCVLDGSVTLSGTLVYSNSAAGYGGGVFVFDDSATLNMSGGGINDNSASYYGGGICVLHGSATLSGTHVLGNWAASDGGGMSVWGIDATLNVSGGEIIDNLASRGGGVFIDEGSVTLSGTQMLSNSATSYGGGVYVYAGRATLSVSGGEITDNSASAGGGVYVYRGSTTLSETQITANDAPDGSAVYQSAGTITPTTALTVTGNIYQAGGRLIGSYHDLRIEGALVLAGGDFYAPDAPTSTFTLTGLYTHTGGTYHQIQPVNGSGDVRFPKTGGLIINANGQDLGSIEVADIANADCAGVAPGEAVQHCYMITPTLTVGRAATITFYYQNDEAKPGHDCTVMEAYRWTGTWDNVLTRDGDYGSSGRLCSSDPQSIRVVGVDAFSPFALRGPAPEIEVTPVALDFGEQDVDAGATVSQTVTITNDGSADLHIANIALTGDDPSAFFIESGGEAVTVTAGSTHTVQVAFDPASTGVLSANVSIQSNDSDEPTVDVTLAGMGVDQEITVAPSSLAFGEQDVDAGATVSQTVTITNDGSADLHIASIALTGDDTSAFVIESGGETVTVTANGTHTVQVTFDPTSTGAKSANLSIQSDDSDEPAVDVTLTGTGVYREITVAPLSLAFGEQDVDAGPTVSQTVTISNDGLSDLHVSAVTSAGDTGAFNLSDSGESTLTSGSTRTIEVSFDPASTGTKLAILSIQSDDSDEGTVSVILIGTGTSVSSTYTLTVHKDGMGSGTVTSDPEGIACGASCQASFTEGTAVTLTTTADASSIFAGWSGACTDTGTCQVTMDAAQAVTATFTLRPGQPGYGSTPAPGSTLDLGTAEVGSTVSTTLTIRETGDMTLTATPALSGPDVGDFDVSTATLTLVDDGAAQDLVIACTPSVSATRVATLTVTHNAVGSPALYALRCTGSSGHSIFLPLVLRNS